MRIRGGTRRSDSVPAHCRVLDTSRLVYAGLTTRPGELERLRYWLKMEETGLNQTVTTLRKLLEPEP